MVDGFGTAFASELILEENDGTGYGISSHNENAVDAIMSDFMGIDRYIKMPTLPYDGIHHIDMHMKLLDEETLLVGEYPQGVADGPQIESNLNYVLNNFNSVFGTDYKVIRVPMPPEGGQYPNQNGDYRTYTNSVFVNNTILVPIYEEQWDTTALRIYREALPGYEVVGIDCNEIITASGAIHCITKAVASYPSSTVG
jgi:agmatine deiminase